MEAIDTDILETNGNNNNNNNDDDNEEKSLYFCLHRTISTEDLINPENKRSCQILPDYDFNKINAGKSHPVDVDENNLIKRNSRRKTSITINGKDIPLKIMDIDIGENSEALKTNQKSEQVSREHDKNNWYANVNTSSDDYNSDNNENINENDNNTEKNKQTNDNKTMKTALNISTSFDGLINKINDLGDELNQIEKKCLNKEINKANNERNEVKTSIYVKVENVSSIEHCGSYQIPTFVNLDDLIIESKDNGVVEEQRESNSQTETEFNNKALAVNQFRRRSLSVGGKILPLQRGHSEDIPEPQVENNLNKNYSKSCFDLLNDSQYSTDDENCTRYSPVKKTFRKRSFIGKSISVDLYHEDDGYFSSKTRRNGLNFDSNSDEEAELQSHLAFVKEKYKQKSKHRSTGLKFARSVENLLKIDKINDSQRRKRSNTDLKVDLPVQRVTKKTTKKSKKRLFSKDMMIRETSILGEEDEKLDVSQVHRVQKVAGIIEMYVDQSGDVIRKIEIQKITGQSLGFFIRCGNGIERVDGIFISRVTLGSFADVNNLLHAGDEILQINKIDVIDCTIEDVAKIMQKAQSLIIKTRSALPLPLHVRPLLNSYQSTPDGHKPMATSMDTSEAHEKLIRTRSDPMKVMHNLHTNLTRDRANTGIDENAEDSRKDNKQNSNLLREPTTTNKKGSKSPTFYRKLLKDINIEEDDTNNMNASNNFSRAQKYQLKAPTPKEIDTSSSKPSKKFIRSPKLFRKADKKQNVGYTHSLPVNNNLMSLPSNDSLSSSSDTDDGSNTEIEIYKSDSVGDDTSKSRGLNGKLTFEIHNIVNSSVKANNEYFYCTIELDGEFKAKTESRKITETINFDESFELELRNSRTLLFYIFKKDDKIQGTKQHKLVSESCIQLENVVGHKNKNFRNIILKSSNELDIKLKIEFVEAESFLQRSPSTKSRGIFGFNLSQTLVKEENTIPILVRKCVEEIEKRGLDLLGIYRISGNARKKKCLRKQFEENSAKVDVSDEFEVDCHMLAGILKDYLRELPNPLISQDMYLNLFNISKEENFTDQKKQRVLMDLMKKLPITNRATLIYIMEHLQRVIELKEENKMDAKNLAVCFGPTMMCPPINATNVTDMFDFKKQIQALEFLINIWPKKVAQNSV